MSFLAFAKFLFCLLDSPIQRLQAFMSDTRTLEINVEGTENSSLRILYPHQ